MKASFGYTLLDPSTDHRTVAAQLAPDTLGIEVTIPLVAQACDLGNIDPQHRPDGRGQAAIEAALDWPLPPRGTRLVTVRPDADAYGAMAVLTLRQEGVAIGPDQRARIATIAREDRFDKGAWPGPRGLPRDEGYLIEPGPPDAGARSLIAGLGNRALSPDQAVAIARRWILAAEVPEAWLEKSATASAMLLTALRNGSVRVTAQLGHRVALVEGFAPGALRLGYRLAPVVVAQHQAGCVPRRVVLAQWREGHADLRGAVRTLATDEPGWGGSPTLIGSPQGVACRTELPRVLSVIEACLL